VVPAADHCPHYLLLEQPAGLLSQFQLPAQLGAADPAFARGDIVDDVECLQKGELAMVEQRDGRRGLQPVPLDALPVILPNALAMLIMAALSAFKIIPHFNDAEYFTQLSSTGKRSWNSNKDRLLTAFP